MKFFLDSANLDEIRNFCQMGIIDGVTTNPSIIKNSGQDFFTLLAKICDICPNGDISAEVTALDHLNMYRQAKELSSLAKNIVIKLPFTKDGIITCYKLASENIKTNVTLCFSANQALIAARAGATYISPFIGRIDDLDMDGLELISEIKQIYSNYNYSTQILAASIRSRNHIKQAALIGADVVTVDPKILNSLFDNILTKKGLDIFMVDWQATGQKF